MTALADKVIDKGVIRPYSEDYRASDDLKRLGKFGMAAWALSYGILIVLNDNPKEDTIIATQGVIGVSSAIAGVSSLYMLGWGRLAEAKWKLISNNPGTKRLYEHRGKSVIIEQQRNIARTLQGGALVLGGISAGLGVWAAKLNQEFDLTRQLSPQQTVVSKIARFFVTAQMLEKNWRE